MRGYFLNCEKIYASPEEAQLGFMKDLMEVVNMHPTDTFYWRRTPKVEQYSDFESETQGWICTGRVTILDKEKQS